MNPIKNTKINSPLFILSSLLFVIISISVIVVPKTSWKKIFCGGFSFNNFATVFTTNDTLYNLSVQNNWTVTGNAWGENIGWLTFSPNSSSTVYVADDALSGYLYGENVGWISLSCRNTSSCGTINYGVSNDAEGHLSGFAYGENIGWIDFGTSMGQYQVVISNGAFSGFAYGENIGFINFGIDTYKGVTTWTPRSARPQCNDGLDNDSNGQIDYPADSNCSSGTDTTEAAAGGRTFPPPAPDVGGDTEPEAPVAPLACTSYTYSDWSVCSISGSQTRTVVTSIPDGCTGGAETVLSQVCTPPEEVATTTATSTLPIGFCFTRNITRLVPDTDVKNLQIFLNIEGFGATLPGAENEEYNTGTVLAVTAFQEKYAADILTPAGLTVGTGNFGTSTRIKANSILGCETIIEVATTTPELIEVTDRDLVILPEQSGKATINTSRGQLILNVPVNNVDTETTFRVQKEDLSLTEQNISTLKIVSADDSQYRITAVNKLGAQVTSFAQPLTIILPIPTDLQTAQNLGVYYKNETTGSWILVSGASFANGKATFTVNHLTVFAILSTEQPVVPPAEEPEQPVVPEQPQAPAGGGTEAIAIEQPVVSYTQPQTTSGQAVEEIFSEAPVAVQEAVQQVVVVTEKAVVATKEAINTPVGSAVTKTVSTVGVVAGAGASIGAVAFANPITLAEIWLIPAKIFGLLMSALGIRRKNREWGTVYDSITKRPLDPVYVSLINIETNKEVSGVITDIDGRYGFLVLPGKYRIEVKKTNYTSPSVIMKGRTSDEVYNDLYFGEEIIVTEEGQTITKNIPMDSMSFDWNEFAKTKMDVNTFMKSRDIKWAKISNILFALGAIVSLIAVVAAPAPYNAIIAGFYILAYVLNHTVWKVKKAGTLTEKVTNAPLSFAIVKIFREGEETPLAKKIADKFGDYYILLPNGRYYMTVDKKNDDASYTQVLKTNTLEIGKGIINLDFSL